MSSEGKKIHGDIYDYSSIKDSDINKGNESKVEILCKECNNKWTCLISNHIFKKTGCPTCSNRIRYTSDIFISKSKELYGEMFDYSLITEDMVQNCRSKVLIKCKICYYIWETCINNHINSNDGCRSCNGNIMWTFERFISESQKRHKNLYNYENNNPQEKITCNTKMSICCNKCFKMFSQKAITHAIMGTGCPHCNRSKGELQCIFTFEKYGITYREQFNIENTNGRRFDFIFSYNNRQFLLEYDGLQHFSPHYRWYREEGAFEKARERDIVKTKDALSNNYTLIRIDYTQLNNVESHIINGINSTTQLYLSDPVLYSWIIDGLQN